jgi:diguanylate cyclase (GGDEF)-like protein
LTGLPNRALFTDRLHQAIERYNARIDYGFSVLFLDFDRFKVVNDSLGHTVGDKLLVGIAERLLRCVRPSDTVARLGGDEFTILLEDVSGVEQAAGTAERIGREFSRPFVLGGQLVHTSASIGIAPSTYNYTQPEDVLRDADIAMYRAKALGKATFQVFTAEMGARAASLLTLDNDLRRAVERRELRVYYQPIVAVASGQLEGVEALLRWQHPRLGTVSLAEFMPIAEETGLIVELDRWTLHEACRQVQAWQGVLPLTLNVNLSGQAFAHPHLVERVGTSLAKTGFDPTKLNVELTESVLVRSSEGTLSTLSNLKALGVQLYIDDFGTGYSSLSYLQRLPIDALKIDRSFVQRMTINSESMELVRTILTMARNLNLSVVAEGVETSRQLKRLERLGCPYAQGYLFSKPLSAEAMTSYLAGETLKR